MVAEMLLRVNSRVMSRSPLVSFLLPPPSFFAFCAPSRPLSFLSYPSTSLAFVRAALDSPAFPRTHRIGRSSSSSFEFENTAISVTAPYAAALCVHTYVYLVPTAYPSFFPSSRSHRPRCRLPEQRFYHADCSRIDVLPSWEEDRVG